MKNNIELIGTIASEPSVFKGRVNFTLAGTTTPNPETGKGRTFYHSVTLWGGLADSIGAHLEVGQGISLTGRLNYSEYERDGVKRNSVDITGTDLRFLDPESFEIAVDEKGQPRMMGARNRAIVQGNLVAVPDLRYTPGGKAVCDARIAINDSYRNRDGEQVKTTHYLSITAWEDDAERLAELTKGDPIQVDGTFDEESWNDKDGNRRYSKKITASNLVILARNLASVSSAAANAVNAPRSAPAAYGGEEELPF